MESISYLINRNFILIAVDSRFELNRTGIETFKVLNAKKVYRLTDKLIVSAIGNPYRVSDLYKYLLKLANLEKKITFDQIIIDVHDVFGSSQVEITQGIIDIKELLPKFMNEKDELDTNRLFEHLKDKPDYVATIRDSIIALTSPEPALTQVYFFGWDIAGKKTRLSQYVSFGQNLQGTELNDMQRDFVYLRLSSAKLPPAETTAIENESIQRLHPLMQPGWDTDAERISIIIEKGKELLASGLQRVTPYEGTLNVIYYELSHRTNYSFIEPELKLIEIEYQRKS